MAERARAITIDPLTGQSSRKRVCKDSTDSVPPEPQRASRKRLSRKDRLQNALSTKQGDQCFCTTSNIRLCTSGYNYKHWHEAGSFYEDLPVSAEFSKYSAVFNTVELNATYYGWFKEETFDKWRERANSARSSFMYIVKASSLYTHKKRLKVDDYFIDSWHRFWNRCQRLDKHLGPVLFQLPENFALYPQTDSRGRRKSKSTESNLPRLQALAELLPRDGRFVFEFRHKSWFCQEVYDIFRKNNWCLALIDVSGVDERGEDEDQSWAINLEKGPNPSPEKYPLEICSWGAYVRFHGASGKYCGAYGRQKMDYWAEILIKWAATGRQVYVAFNNTDDGVPPSAIADARDLTAALRHLGEFT